MYFSTGHIPARPVRPGSGSLLLWFSLRFLFFPGYMSVKVFIHPGHLEKREGGEEEELTDKSCIMSDSPKEISGKRKRRHDEENKPLKLRRQRSSSDSSVSFMESSGRNVAAKSSASMYEPMGFKQSSEKPGVAASSASMYEPMGFRKSSEEPGVAASSASMYEPMGFRKSSEEPVASASTENLNIFQQRPLRPMCCVCEEAFEENPLFFTCGHVTCTNCIISNREQSETPTQFHCTECGTTRRVAPTQRTPALETWNSHLLDTMKIHKTEMLKKFSWTSEGNGDEKRSLNQVYTSLSITFGKTEVPQEHYFKHLWHQQRQSSEPEINVNLSNIFVNLPTKLYRTVLTNGVAGIGKSFSVQKFIVDWAEDQTNTDVDFIFNLAFRELNLIKNEKSLLQLLIDFHPALSDVQDPEDFVRTKMIVILDGFDESRFNLDFKNAKKVTSVEDVTSVESLITNLIQRNLLPSAQLWITSRPAASHQIPGEFIDSVTEIKGFNDQQREEYFRKRFSNNPRVGELVISHIQSSPTFDMLCQIPIFCWISAVLFQEVFGAEEKTEAPQTLTEMMAQFLFVQTKRSSRKYDNNPEKHREKLLKANQEILLKLGKLAFIHLLKNSLIFYEEDLKECGLEPKKTVKSGFFNAILRDEELFSQKKVYFFVHLTVQEFFAAVYVYNCFTNNKTWAPDLSSFLDLEHTNQSDRPAVFELLKRTVDKVLEKNSGCLVFFIRFLLGLVVESNQRLVHGLLVPLDPSQETVKKMLLHLKAIRRKSVSPDGCIILFQIMVEMGDTKTKEEIQKYLKSQDRSRIELTPLHCSALVFTLQVSKNVLEELDLKSYNTSEEGRRRLIPAVRSSRKAILADCHVSTEWVKHLSVALTFPHSSLRDLDLSNNDLRDSGVELLCDGLKSSACRLEVLRLSGCLVTEKGCGFLVSALQANPLHLKELDLSYNHLDASGEAALTKLKSDPQYNLNHLKINMSHGGSQQMVPGLMKYFIDLTWDTERAHKSLDFSKDGRRVSRAEEASEQRLLVLAGQGLNGRCYWELEAKPPLNIGVTYWDSGQERKGFRLGQNEESWSFVCSKEGRYIFHNNQKNPVVIAPCIRSNRLGIYLDHPTGVLSFYRVNSDNRTHLHTFREKFTRDLFPVVELQPKASASFSDKNKAIAEQDLT